ncbi:LPXTG cell wall anchor domain-containing protein [Corynebacterium sp. UBA2622]|uniref:LPXTG cell wall anchor domain-containing protein n=1 Tax=Corynebacterium sp. UBA2622 TaxID=1946393 RepID=UPI0025BAA079|nr:LPXTG cell wall anchor domain-containing protein [Corynebacterium sp. UBA2622]
MVRDLRGLTAACAAAAIAVGAAPAVVPGPVPAAHAQAAGSVRVSLVEAVGEQWFESIGDRTLILSRAPGLDPTKVPWGGGGEVDLPAGTKLEEVARTTTVDGVAEFTGLAPGVYYLTVEDSPTGDARVSYAPMVLALTAKSPSLSVAPKAQVLGISSEPLTACNTPAWKDAAAPGTYVEYDYTASVPNPSYNGTIGVYALTFEFSVGHTVQWKKTEPETSIEAVAAAAGHPSFTFAAAASQQHVEAEGEPWWTKLIGKSRKDENVVKLEAPTLTMTGDGDTRTLAEGVDYTVTRSGNDSATFILTDAARAELAKLRMEDPNTTVHIRVPAKANTEGPWGTAVSANVLGTLEATATLRTDGMDAKRTPVEVAKTSHINVVKRGLCFLNAGDANNPPVPGDGSSSRPSRNPSNTSGGDNAGSDGRGGNNTGNNGSGVSQRTSSGSGGSGSRGSNDGNGGGGASSSEKRTGPLASTGASVLGLVGVAVLLILLGLWLRRRRNGDGE